MIKPTHYIFPFGKENAEVVYSFNTLVSLTDYGTFGDEFYENKYHLLASIYKNHDPVDNIDVYILYFYINLCVVGIPADEPQEKQLTLVFDTLQDCISFLVPYLTDTKEQLDFIQSYHEDFHGKDNDNKI